MAFNGLTLKKWRERNNLSQRKMASQLGLSGSYLSKLECGERIPSTVTLQKISEFTLNSPEIYLNPSPIDGEHQTNLDLPLLNAAMMGKRMNEMGAEYINVMRERLQSDKQNEKLASALSFAASLVSIYKQQFKGDKDVENEVRDLVRFAKTRNLLDQETICRISKISSATISKWLEPENFTSYECQMDLKEPVLAQNQIVAGLAFACFDCEHRRKDRCRGYGGTERPENAIMLLEILDDNGVSTNTAQSNFLREHYQMDYTPQTISEYKYRWRNARHVPEQFMHMEPT
jgi:transcriptional regulator with XRE-family HTH domain